MSLLLVAMTAAHAAPSADACQRWADQLKAGAQTAMAGLDQIEDHRIRDLSGTISPGPLLARVRGGACEIQSVGSVGLNATLALAKPGGRGLSCPVKVQNAMVPLKITIAGTDAAPKVTSSTLPVEALAPFMTTCVRASWVDAAVVKLASSWIDDQKTAWHAELEKWLAQGH